jgi:hypothetical protein
MGAVQEGRRGCISVAAKNIDDAVSQALLSALRPTVLQSAFDAYEKETLQGSRKIEALELALQQARYESQRARRQFDAAEPENRLVCGELEKRWEQTLRGETQAEQALEQARKNSEVTRRQMAPFRRVGHSRLRGESAQVAVASQRTESLVSRRARSAVIRTSAPIG